MLTWLDAHKEIVYAQAWRVLTEYQDDGQFLLLYIILDFVSLLQGQYVNLCSHTHTPNPHAVVIFKLSRLLFKGMGEGWRLV